MPLSEDQVLEQIFGQKIKGDFDRVDPSAKAYPRFRDVRAFARLLAEDSPEESLQRFLEDHPQLLLEGPTPAHSGEPAAIFSKPAIADKYRADFAILDYGQGGCSIVLIEIERPLARLFTATGQPAEPLRRAIVQVQDWAIYLKRRANHEAFCDEKIRDALRLPEHPESTPDGSRRFKAPDMIQQLWTMFGGYDITFISYLIVIGRWALLNPSEQARLVHHNQTDRSYTVITYDQIVRRAFEVRIRDWV